MKKLILMLAVILAGASAFASDCCKSGTISFSELPFAEGKLYVSVFCGDECVLQSVADVDSDTAVFPVNLSKWDGKSIEVKAYQDLNDNNTLDFDSYGRPQEPCLHTSVTVDSKNPVLDFNLMQY